MGYIAVKCFSLPCGMATFALPNQINIKAACGTGGLGESCDGAEERTWRNLFLRGPKAVTNVM